MQQRLIARGIIAGAIAGLLAFVFARIFAEPQIQQAIDYESGREAAQAALDKAAGLAVEPAGAEVFSRAVQGNVGIGVGIIAFGAALGAMFAVVYAVCLGRVGNLRPRTLALLVAGGGFLGVYLLPFLKYPANPPAVGHADTIKERGTLYLLLVGSSIVLLALAAWLGQKLAARFGNWNASLLAGGAFLVAIGVLFAVLPPFGHLGSNVARFGQHSTETPLPLTDASGAIVYPGFPADVLFSFRLYSVAAQLILWTAIGLVFAPLAERLLAPPVPAAAAVTR
jgi:Probable cobalt transporter subunit (CbtA)